MTLFKLTDTQKEYLIKNLFHLAVLPNSRDYYRPTHIMFYADNQTQLTGVLFLKRNYNGVDFRITDYSIDGELLPTEKVNNMIAYMDSKDFTFIPSNTYQVIKNLLENSHVQ